MKKMLLATLVAGLMSVSAMALEGTISKIMAKSDGTIKIVIAETEGAIIGKFLGGTADSDKAMLAIALTAKSSGATVEAYKDGTIWTNITILSQP